MEPTGRFSDDRVWCPVVRNRELRSAARQGNVRRLTGDQFLLGEDMTWRQLADAVSTMRPEFVDQPVRFVEPYDEGGEGYLLDLFVAQEDIYVGPSAEERMFVGNGEPFLS